MKHGLKYIINETKQSIIKYAVSFVVDIEPLAVLLSKKTIHLSSVIDNTVQEVSQHKLNKLLKILIDYSI